MPLLIITGISLSSTVGNYVHSLAPYIVAFGV